jgi:hypothetical protein
VKVKKNTVPASRYSGPPHRRQKPIAMTVGELKKALEQYPDQLPIRCGLDDGVQLIWFNVGRDTECLGLEDNDGTWED